MHIGETVAMVVAETMAAAQDGAEAVEVEYEPLDAGGRSARRARQAARRSSGRKRRATSRSTGPARTRPRRPTPRRSSASSRRPSTSRKVSLLHNRLNVASMEPRGATASYDKAADSFHLRVCSQGARAMRDAMAQVMKIGNDKIRVTTEDVGGAFGLKTGPYPEYIAILVAREEDRPPGVLDVGPLGGVPHRQPRARRLQRRGAGARREGQVPGAAHPPSLRDGRLYRRGRRQHRRRST